MASKKMLVAGAAGVAVVAIYAAIAWGLGRAAHARYDEVEAQLAEQPLPIVKVAERQYTPGVFSSVELITLEVDTELLRSMSQSDSSEFPTDEEAAEAGFEQAAEQVMEDDAAEEPEPVETEEAPRAPVRVTFRNEMQHGPFPGFSSVGLVRINTTLVLDGEARAIVAKVFEGQEPLVVDTLVGFAGGGRVHATSPSFTYEDEEGRFNWEGIEAHFTHDRDVDSMTCDFRAPGAQGQWGDSAMTLGKIEFKCDFDRVFGELFAGTSSMEFESLHFTAGGKPIAIDSIAYTGEMRVNGEYLDTDFELGVGKIQAADLDVSNIRYDITLNRLHGPTYTQLMRQIEAMSSPQALEGKDPAQAISALVKPAMTLIGHAPELVIKRVSFTMPEGEASVTGTVKLKEIANQDPQSPTFQMDLMRSIDASLDVSVANGLLERDWSAGAATPVAEGDAPHVDRAAALRAQVDQLAERGFITRNEDVLTSRLEFKDGQLTANGKALGPGP